MTIRRIAPQLRTMDLVASIRFYTETLGFTLEFKHQDFYAGIRAGNQVFHLKQVDDQDPSIPYVDESGHLHLYFEVEDIVGFAAELKSKGVTPVKDVHDTAWNTREFIIHDDQGHTLYFGQPI